MLRPCRACCHVPKVKELRPGQAEGQAAPPEGPPGRAASGVRRRVGGLVHPRLSTVSPHAAGNRAGGPPTRSSGTRPVLLVVRVVPKPRRLPTGIVHRRFRYSAKLVFLKEPHSLQLNPFTNLKWFELVFSPGCEQILFRL